MKKVLSLLVCFVFLQTQSWALSGGPVFGAGDAAAISGTYAGVLLPDTSVLETPGSLLQLDPNALGLFSLGIPTVGVASGAAAIFNRGEVFTGTIVGVADPGEGTLKALVEMSAIRIITVEVAAGSAVGAFGSDIRAVGKLEAEITGESSAVAGTSSAQRIEGTAVLNTFSDSNRNADGTPIISGLVAFVVDGFKQSEDVSPSDINFNISVGNN